MILKRIAWGRLCFASVWCVSDVSLLFGTYALVGLFLAPPTPFLGLLFILGCSRLFIVMNTGKRTPYDPSRSTRIDWSWTQDAERVGLTPKGKDMMLLGECDNGYMWVPSLWKFNTWRTPFRPVYPWHMVVYLVSKLRNKIAWLERF